MMVEETQTLADELNRIRLEESLPYDDLAAAMGLSGRTVYRLLNEPGVRIYDRTEHKIRRFLESRRAKPVRRRRSAAAEARVTP